MAVVTVVRSHPNREGVYLDGYIEYQNHMNRVWPEEVLRIVDDEQIDAVEHVTAADDQEGHLPSNITDAVWYDGVLADE